MCTQSDAFPVPRKIRERIDAFEFGSSEDSAGEELSEVGTSQRSVKRKRHIKSFSALREYRKNRFNKRNLSTKRSPEERAGLISGPTERASAKSGKNDGSSCAAEFGTPSTPTKQMPREKLAMSSQVDMFAKTPPRKDEVKEEKATPKKYSLANLKAADENPQSPRRSSRIKSHAASSISEFKPPTVHKVSQLRTAQREARNGGKSVFADPKVDDECADQSQGDRELQPTSLGNRFADSDDDFKLKIDVSPVNRSFDADVSENKNSAQGGRSKQNSPFKKSAVQNKSPNKRGSKNLSAGSPDKSMSENVTENDGIASLDVVVPSEAAAKHPPNTNTLNRNSPIHYPGSDDSRDGASTKSEEVARNAPDRSIHSFPSQLMRKSYELSPTPLHRVDGIDREVHIQLTDDENIHTTHELQNVSPKKTALKDGSIKKSFENREHESNKKSDSDDSGVVSKSGNATDSGNSTRVQKNVSESNPKLVVLVSESESDADSLSKHARPKEEPVEGSNSSLNSEDDAKTKNVVDTKRSVSSKNPIIGKKMHSKSSDSESESHAADKLDATNCPKIPTKEDFATSSDSDSDFCGFETKHSRAQRKLEILNDKGVTGIAKKKGSDDSASDTNLNDSKKSHLNKHGPTATSTQKIIVLQNKTNSSNSESNSSQAVVKKTAKRMGKQNPIISDKSGDVPANKPHTDGNDAESESSDSEDGGVTKTKDPASRIAKMKENENSSNSDSSFSEDEKSVKAQQSNVMAPQGLQKNGVPKPERISTSSSSSNSDVDSDKSNGGKNVKEAEPPIVSRSVTAASKTKDDESSVDSDSSQSKNVKQSNGIAPQLRSIPQKPESCDSESDSSESVEEETPNSAQQTGLARGSGKTTPLQAPQIMSAPKKLESSKSESDSSVSVDEKFPNTAHKTVLAQVSGKATACTAQQIKSVTKKHESSDSESDSTVSEDVKPSTVAHQPVVHLSGNAIAPQIMSARKKSESSDSESDSSVSVDEKLSNIAHKTILAPVSGKATADTAQQIKNAPKKTESSNSESDSSASDDKIISNTAHQIVVAQVSGKATAGTAQQIKSVTKNDESSNSESDSAVSDDVKPSAVAHQAVVVHISGKAAADTSQQIKNAPKKPESSDSESDSSASDDKMISNTAQQTVVAQASSKVRIALETGRKETNSKYTDSSDSDSDNDAKVGELSLTSRIPRKNSFDSDSSDSEKEKKPNLLTIKNEPKRASGDESRKQAITNKLQKDNSDSDSTNSHEQGTVERKIRLRPTEHLKTLPSMVQSTGGNSAHIPKRPQSLENSSSDSSDDASSGNAFKNAKRFSKQSGGPMNSLVSLKRKASVIGSPDSNSPQRKAKLQKYGSPVNYPSAKKIYASGSSSSSSVSGDSDSEQHETHQLSEKAQDCKVQKGDESAQGKSLADQSTRRAEVSVKRKRKADSVSSSDSSDSEPKNKQRKLETPITLVAPHNHPVNSTVRGGDIQPAFPGSDISFIPKPGSTPSKAIPSTSKPINQRSILEFARPRTPVSSTPELPQKKARENLDLLKSRYLNSGYEDVGEHIDFDSHPGLFEEDLLEKDVVVYVVQCPQEVDPESLVGQKIDLRKKESSIEIEEPGGATVPYDVYCDLNDSNVGVSLITPSKRRKKFTLTSVPVAGRITIAETLHVPPVQEVASTSPTRVPFPKNLKPRNPFVDHVDTTAQEILKKIKQKNSKKSHERSAPSCTFPEFQSNVKTAGNKLKYNAQRTAEVYLSSEKDHLPEPRTKPKTAVPQESLGANFEDGENKKKKKKKKDKSSEDAPASLRTEPVLNVESSSDTTKTLLHKQQSDPTPKKSKEKKKKRDKNIPVSSISSTATEDLRHNILAGCTESSDATTEKTKKKKKDKSSKAAPETLSVECVPKAQFIAKGLEGLRGEAGEASDKKKKKKKKEKELGGQELPSSVKNESLPSHVRMLNEPLPTSESDVASDRKKEKKREKKEKKTQGLNVPSSINTEGVPSQALLPKAPPASESEVTSDKKEEKKKKKKKKKEKGLEGVNLPSFINTEYVPSQELLHNAPPTSEFDVTSDKKKEKKRKKREAKQMREDIETEPRDFPSEVPQQEEPLPTSGPAKKKKKKHRDQ